MAATVLIVEDDPNIANLLEIYLKKEGYTVKISDFFKIGIPFTLAAIIPAYVYLWLVYGV